jgi:Secretion system C-terminal sorting domain
MNSLPIKTIALYILVSTLATVGYATNYYVDPSSTSSTANGSLLYPWKTISQVNSGTTLLNPGDTVFFKRGQVYSGRLTVNRSGSSAAPIVYTNYGTGELPEFNNSVSGIINIYNKQYIVIDGFKIIDRSISETDHTVQAKISYAINIENSPYCTIRNCDISRVGVGISVTAGSNYTNIIGNYMHNMRMVRNTPTSVNPDDDYGANPMVIGTSNNLISNNRFEECWALSYDYGYDGGAVEFFGANMNNNKVIYNTAINCNGFIEIGSNTNGLAENNIIAYNKIINCGIIGVYQNGSTFTVAVKNLQYYNNTIVETIKQYAKPSVLFWMAGTGTPGMVTVKNNIFWLSSGVNVASSKFNTGQMIHTNNIYRMSSGLLGMTLNSSEILSNNASIFTNTTGDVANWNLQLPTGSLAINFGTTIGINKDFAGNPITDAPDAGIYESTSQIQKIISTPLNATISAGTISCFGGTTSINVTASGGVLPYTGIGSFNVKAGTHTYIVTDAQGLKDTVSTTITEPKAIASSLTSGTISSTGGTTTIQVSTTGGTTPYSYSLNNLTFQSSNTFYGIAAGSYTVTTKDANGCTGSNSITINSYSTTLSYVRYKVRIYPNPTTNYFVLKISYFSKPETVFISVVDINGKIVETTSGDIYSTFYIGQNLNRGTYYIKVKVGTTTKTYTVMKI